MTDNADTSVNDAAMQTFADTYAGTEETTDDTNAGADDAQQQDSSDTDTDQDAGAGQDDTTSEDTSDESSKADETKTEESDKDEGEGDEGKDEDANEAQSYDEFVLPEGMEVDQDALDEVTSILAEHKIPQEGAQKVVDVGAKMMSKMAQKASEAHQEIVQGWEKDTLSQFGKGGEAAFEERKATAQMAIDKFFPDEQRNYITSWGIGNMSGFFAMAEAIGQAMKEDGSFSTGAGDSNGEKTAAEVWYPES